MLVKMPHHWKSHVAAYFIGGGGNLYKTGTYIGKGLDTTMQLHRIDGIFQDNVSNYGFWAIGDHQNSYSKS